MRERHHAAVPVLLASLLFVAGCEGSASSAGPTADRSAGTDRLGLSGTAVGTFAFGTSADDVVTGLSARFGKPDVTVGPERFQRPAGKELWFEDKSDPMSAAWGYPVLSVSCWQSLCVLFGGNAEDKLALRGWELASVSRWADGAKADPTLPGVALAGTGIKLGDTWEALHAAYPAATVNGAEGSTIAVDHTPWEGIFDGVATWRLSGQWDFEKPTSAPPGAAVTRLSAGEGPELGCC